MSTQNQIVLTKKIYYLNQENNGCYNYLYFREIVPNEMYRWFVKCDRLCNIKGYNIIDLEGVIDYINNLFIKQNDHLYCSDNIDDCVNVFRSSVTVQTDCGPISKLSKDLTPQDIQNLDLWQDKNTYVANGNFRYCNKIPLWQRSMNTRFYEKSNEGFDILDPARSSLENQIHGYY